VVQIRPPLPSFQWVRRLPLARLAVAPAVRLAVCVPDPFSPIPIGSSIDSNDCTNVLDGKVVGHCMQQHRHQEFIRFLNTVEAAVPAGKLIHGIVDNDATHKHPKVREWLVRHPHWTFYFTPASASWLNAVEDYFAKLTRRRLKPGVFHSIVELQAAIKRFLAETNADPRPFRWTKDSEKIIAAVKKGHQVLNSIH
jgi:transposase